MQKMQRDESGIEKVSALEVPDYSRKEMTAAHVTASQGWGVKLGVKFCALVRPKGLHPRAQ